MMEEFSAPIDAIFWGNLVKHGRCLILATSFSSDEFCIPLCGNEYARFKRVTKEDGVVDITQLCPFFGSLWRYDYFYYRFYGVDHDYCANPLEYPVLHPTLPMLSPKEALRGAAMKLASEALARVEQGAREGVKESVVDGFLQLLDRVAEKKPQGEDRQ